MKRKGLKIMLLAVTFLMLVVGSAQATGQLEGCTPGYWKNHLDSWQGYAPDDSYADVFGVPYDKTLLQVLKTGGGGEKAMGRHAVAALLNAQQLTYRWDIVEVTRKVQRAYGYEIFEYYKDQFEYYNEQYCPLN
ncbi:MAG: hypothetical protein GY803_24455 [Chloroflexi bacterium]|nr:hypothetical protein [Chloroflexota bacterium]